MHDVYCIQMAAWNQQAQDLRGQLHPSDRDLLLFKNQYESQMHECDMPVNRTANCKIS